MNLINRIKDYPISMYLPFFFRNLSDVVCWYNDKSLRHKYLRIPAFNFYHESLKKHIYIKYLQPNIDNSQNIGQQVPLAPIWVMWWQGLDQAPELVRMCIASIKRNSCGYPVNIITKDNYREYVCFPDYIIQKVEKGYITLTHFSDIMRFALLYEHGGLWMDATLYLHRNIPEWIFNIPFFTAKRRREDTYYRYPETMWNGFFIGAYKNSFILKTFRDTCYSYWKKNNSLLEYFLIDYIISSFYKENQKFKDIFDSLSINNSRITWLMNDINLPADPDVLEKYNTETDFVSKLSYKKNVQQRTKKGEITFYGKMLEDYQNCQR